MELIYTLISESLLNSGRYFLGDQKIYSKIEKYFLPPLIKNWMSVDQDKLKVRPV